MNRNLLLLSLIALTVESLGQLSGIKTIPGNYATIAAAVGDLNAQGVGPGGVTFNVSAGHTENITAPIVVTATGTAGNLVLFQKSGAGANPSITRTDGGTISTSVFGSNGDAIIRLEGADYFTWKEINLNASSQGIEYGFMTSKPNGNNGCQSVNVTSSVITMTKGTSGMVTGIYISNGPTTSSLPGGVIVTSPAGKNLNIILKGNTIQNVHVGIHCRGYQGVYIDENITIGQPGFGNSILNFGGGNTTTSYGIYFYNVANPSAGENVIDNQGGGGSPHGGTLYGIDIFNASGSIFASNNNMTLSNNSASAGVLYIYTNKPVTNTYIDGNIFSASTMSTTGLLRFIQSAGSFSYTSISDNSTSGAILHGGGTTEYISLSGTEAGGSEIINGNSFTNITVSSGSLLLRGIYVNTPYVTDRECSNNTLSSLSHNGTGEVMGIELLGSSVNNQLLNNSITGLSGGGTMTGLKFYGSILEVSGNTIHTLSTTGASLTGMSMNSGGNTHCYKNHVHTLSTTHSSAALRGILINAGNQVLVYNNIISNLNTPSANLDMALAGVYVSAGTSIYLFYNTIYLNASSSGALFGSAGVYTVTSNEIELKNNIIVNTSTPNGASGYTAAYRRSGTSLGTYSGQSNCNDFYAGTPGPNRLIFYDGTNAVQTLADFKALAGTRDAASVTELPPFVNSTTPPFNLHLQAAIATQCESGGVTVNSPILMLADFDGNTRNANTPDIGADEFSGVKNDLMPPVITFTSLPNTSSTISRTLVTSITDATGVPVSGTGLPRLYYRVNGSAYFSIQGIHVSGSRYDFTFGGSVSLNDLVEYFIVAQDLSGTPKVGSQPLGGAGIFSANPPSCATPPTSPYSYTVVGAISGPVTIGAGGTYPSLTGTGGLFEAINARIVTGNLTASIISDLVEDGANDLNQWQEEGAGNYTLTIRPDGTSLRNISGNYLDGLIRLNGADRVTIDGRYNGTGSYLHFSNTSTSTSTAVIHLISLGLGKGAKDNTIRNCTISAGSNTVTSAYAIYAGGSTVGSGSGYDNDNLSILENTIHSAYYGIVSTGGVDPGRADNLLISGNTIGGDTTATYITYRGINILAQSAPVIRENHIYNIRIGTLTTNSGIEVGNYVNDAVIDRNHIHGLESSNPDGWGTYGISVNGSGIANVTISNNVIYDLVTYGFGNDETFNPFGIRIDDGNVIKVYHNTVHLYGAFLGAGSPNRSAALNLSSATVSGADLRNNVFMNSMTGSTSQTCCAISVNTMATLQTINNNDYFVSGPNGVLGFNSSYITTFAGWQAWSGQDAQSVNADPMFTDALLHLSNPFSPAIGAATSSVPVTVDYIGYTRHPGYPTMGAHEYKPANNWLGYTSAWTSAGNWGRNAIPDNSFQVVIPASPIGGNFPVVPAGTHQCHSLLLENGSNLNIQGSLEVLNSNL